MCFGTKAFCQLPHNFLIVPHWLGKADRVFRSGKGRIKEAGCTRKLPSARSTLIQFALAVRLRNCPSLRRSIRIAVGAPSKPRTCLSGTSAVGPARASSLPSLRRYRSEPASLPSGDGPPLPLRRRRRCRYCAAVGRVLPSHLRGCAAASVGRSLPSRLRCCAAASSAPPHSTRVPPRRRRCASVGRRSPPHLRYCVAASAASPPPPSLPRRRRSDPAVAPPIRRRRFCAGGDPPPLLQHRSSARSSYLISRGFY